MPKVSYDPTKQRQIANRIRRELGKRGLTQNALVDIWQIGRTNVSGKLNGKTPVSETQIKQFEQAMGMQPGELEKETEITTENFEQNSRAKTIKNILKQAGKTQKDLAQIWGMNEASVSRKLSGQTAIKQRHIELLEEALHMPPGTILAGNGIIVGSTVHVEQNNTQQAKEKEEMPLQNFIDNFNIVLKDSVTKALMRYASVFPDETKTTAEWLSLCVALTPNDHL